MHDCRWTKSSSFIDGMLQQQTCRDNKELGLKRTKTSLEQRRCCSRCCRNPAATADKISRMLTNKAAIDTKRLQSKVSKNERHMATRFWLPWFQDVKKSTHNKKKEMSLKKNNRENKRKQRIRKIRGLHQGIQREKKKRLQDQARIIPYLYFLVFFSLLECIWWKK